MFKGVAHAAFVVQDMEKELAFYTGICGFEPAFVLNHADGSPWIHYLKIAPGQFIEFFYGGEPYEKPALGRPAGYGHICFETADIDALAARLHAAGALPAAGAGQGLDGNRAFMLRDPEGNLVEFVQYGPDTPLRRGGEPTPGAGIAHLAFGCRDVQRSLDFYKRMGFTELWKLDREGKPWITYVRLRAGQIIELYEGGEPWEKPAPSPGRRLAGFTHTCIEVEDIFEAVEYLRQNGVAIDREPVLGIELNYQAWIKDPDGEPIELMQISPDSPQGISSRVALCDVLFNAPCPERWKKH